MKDMQNVQMILVRLHFFYIVGVTAINILIINE